MPLQIEAMAVVRSHSAPSLKQERPDISWTLESIVRKCLAPDQRHRYQSAHHLAEDLRRLIDDRPLQYAPELSQRERARKFLRRHPRLTSSGTVAAIAGILLLAVGSAFAGVQNQLAERGAREQVRAHDAGLLRALCLVNTQVDMKDNLRDGIAACEQTLALFGEPESTDWDQNPSWPRIAPAARGRIAEDRRELLLLLADARTRQSGHSRDAAAQALVLLDRAEAIPGLAPSRALWLDRSRYLSMLGQTDQAELARKRALQIPAATARDHYLLATSIIRQGGPEAFADAIAELNEALERNPRDYWALTQRGICRLDRGELVLAAADFAWGYFNRGCVLDRALDKSAAVLDYSAALDRDPQLVPALINRGLARLELNQHDLALADFDRAQTLGSRDPRISAGRGIALERLDRYQEADAAFAACFAHADALPKATRVRLSWAYGFAISARLPQKADAAFDDALRLDPGNAQAVYGKAMLAMSAGQNAEAIRHFDQALRANPALNDARRYRAIALARDGSWSRATQEINLCLKEDHHSPATLYAAACIVALSCGKTMSSSSSAQALDLLEKALGEGIDPARACADPDLAAIRSLPRFTQLITRAQRSRPAPSPK
jgi:tetratricopeptide (TPR) repeat protein